MLSPWGTFRSLCSRASGLAGCLQSVLPSSTAVQSCKCCLVVSNASPCRCLAAEPVWLSTELNALSLPGLGGSSESALSLSRFPFFPFQIEGLGHTRWLSVLAWLLCPMSSCVPFLLPVGAPHPTHGSTDHPRPIHLSLLAWYPESRYSRAQHLLGTYILLWFSFFPCSSYLLASLQLSMLLRVQCGVSGFHELSANKVGHPPNQVQSVSLLFHLLPAPGPCVVSNYVVLDTRV